MATSERSLSFSGRFSGDTVSAKVVMLGMSHVGKTCISKRMQTDTYQSHQKATIYVDYMRIRLSGPDYASPVVLQLWDTCGQEKFRSSLVGLYIRCAHTAVIVYDVTNRISFSSVPLWCQEARKTEPLIRFVLVGNKMDDEDNRQISYEEGKSMADKYECPFYETSAKTGQNVEILFDDIGRDLSHALTSPLLRQRELGKPTSLKLDGDQQKPSKKRTCSC